MASGSFPLCGLIPSLCTVRLGDLPINHQPEVDVMVRQANQIDRLKHGLHFTSDVRCVVRAHSEADQRGNVAENGVPNGRVELAQILIRKNERQTVFAKSIGLRWRSGVMSKKLDDAVARPSGPVRFCPLSKGQHSLRPSRSGSPRPSRAVRDQADAVDVARARNCYFEVFRFRSVGLLLPVSRSHKVRGAIPSCSAIAL